MNVEAFWELIERSRQATSDPHPRRRWLERQLARQAAAEIVDFEILLGQARQRADTTELYGACYRILDGHDSLDGFFYFQGWLVGLGRHAFERAVSDPDSLADVPEVLRLVGRPLDAWADDEWPDGEWLSSAAFQAYEQVAGEAGTIYDAVEARGHRVRALPASSGTWGRRFRTCSRPGYEPSSPSTYASLIRSGMGATCVSSIRATRALPLLPWSSSSHARP